MITPDADQDRVLAAQGRRVVVVAPPGTGKTFCAIRLAARLARDVYDHQRILVLTFSNQARAELHREARRLVPTKLITRVEIRNYHQLFREKVWAYRSALGLPAQLDLISERERLDALRGVLGRAIRRGCACGSSGGRPAGPGSESGGYVTVTAPTDGATAAAGCSSCLRSLPVPRGLSSVPRGLSPAPGVA